MDPHYRVAKLEDDGRRYAEDLDVTERKAERQRRYRANIRRREREEL